MQEFGLNEIIPEGDDDNKLRNVFVSSKDYNLFADTFRVRDHFTSTLRHKNMIYQVFLRLSGKCLPAKLIKGVNILEHDNSAITDFTEVVGYTIKNVWKIENSDLYTQATNHHHLMNPHHPEYFRKVTNKSTPNMRNIDLIESILDRIAVNWEQRFAEKTAPIDSMWEDFPDSYLKYYTEHDRSRIKRILYRCAKKQTN